MLPTFFKYKTFYNILRSLSLIKYDICVLSLYIVYFYRSFFATQVTLKATYINIKLKALSHTEQKLMDCQPRNSGSFLVALPTTTVTIECPFISLKPPVLKDLSCIRILISLWVWEFWFWLEVVTEDSGWQLIIGNNGVVKVDTAEWCPDHRQADNTTRTCLRSCWWRVAEYLSALRLWVSDCFLMFVSWFGLVQRVNLGNRQ